MRSAFTKLFVKLGRVRLKRINITKIILEKDDVFYCNESFTVKVTPIKHNMKTLITLLVVTQLRCWSTNLSQLCCTSDDVIEKQALD